jgi:TRAP-type C4-dicarboxylate transport system substrate-binding protein
VKTPEDVRGKKMRTLQSPLHLEIWRSVGANPTPIPHPEVYNALQTKVVDLADNTKTNYLNSKWYEVAPYFTVLGHVYAIGGVFVPERWWQRLSPEHRQVIQASFEELIPMQHHLVQYDDEVNLQKAVKLGAKVNIVDDKAAWQKAMTPIWESWAAKTPGGKELVQAVVDAK